MADPFPELTRVVEFITPSLRPPDAVGTPGVIPSTLAADLAAVVATCGAAPPAAVAEALEVLRQAVRYYVADYETQVGAEHALGLVTAHIQAGAGPGGERDALLREALAWKPHHEYKHDRERDEKTCPLCQWRVRARAPLPAPAPATETEER